MSGKVCADVGNFFEGHVEVRVGIGFEFYDRETVDSHVNRRQFLDSGFELYGRETVNGRVNSRQRFWQLCEGHVEVRGDLAELYGRETVNGRVNNRQLFNVDVAQARLVGNSLTWMLSRSASVLKTLPSELRVSV